MRQRLFLVLRTAETRPLRDEQSGLPNDRGTVYTSDKSASAVACGLLMAARWLSASSTTRQLGSDRARSAAST